jgi:signal transduction histidine kinase
VTGPSRTITSAEHRALDPRVVIVPIVAMIGFTVLDVVLAARVFDVLRPALAADALVLLGVSIALARGGRERFVGLLVGALGSIAISRAVYVTRIAAETSFTPVMGHGAWPGTAELAGLGFLTGWCLRASRRSVALSAWAVLGIVLIAIYNWRQDGAYGPMLIMLFGGGWIGTGVAGIYLRMLDQRQAANARQVRHDERIAIARELHDMVAHHVTGMVVQAQAARLVAADRPDVALRALTTIEQAGGEAMSAMRMLVGTLRDESTEADVTPTATIQDLRAIAEPPRRGELPVRVSIDSAASVLPTEVMASVHRIAREAVTNARRHGAGATEIDLQVTCTRGLVRLQVSNDGAPVAPARPGTTGFGLRGMAERAAALGGRFAAGPMASGGWLVRAELPLKPAR